MLVPFVGAVVQSSSDEGRGSLYCEAMKISRLLLSLRIAAEVGDQPDWSGIVHG